MKRIKAIAREALLDLLIAGGACAIARGAWLVYEPAGWIVGGAFALGLGLVGLLRSDSPS